MSVKKKECFFISPIDQPDSEIRKNADLVLEYIVRPAAEDAGYVAIRGDEIDKPGLITTQVLQAVMDSPLVIADLTHSNPNVFYELAVRHATRKPTISIIRMDEKIPFDVANSRTVFYGTDMESGSKAKQEITKQIKSMEDGEIIDAPISLLKTFNSSASAKRRRINILLISYRQSVSFPNTSNHLLNENPSGYRTFSKI